MRIIAGSSQGPPPQPARLAGLRPTSDKLRETLFNVLGPSVVGARVLDGYAGTGAVGIEALSRGASHVTFVDSDRRAADLVQANLRHCGRQRAAMLLSAWILRASGLGSTGTRSTSSFSTRRTARQEMASALTAAAGIAVSRRRASSSSTPGAIAPPAKRAKPCG